MKKCLYLALVFISLSMSAQTWTNFAKSNNQGISIFGVDNQFVYFVNYDNFVKYDKTSGILNYIDYPDNYPACYRNSYLYKNCKLDKFGNIWMSTLNRGIFKYSGGVWTNYNTTDGLLSDNSYLFDIMANGHIVLVNYGFSGFSYFNGVDWTIYDEDSSAFIPSTPLGDVITGNNIAYMRTDRGILRFDGSRFELLDSTNSPFPHNEINQIAVDSLGHLWCPYTDSLGLFIGYFEYDDTRWYYHVKSSMQCIDHFTYILENCFGKKKNYFYNNDIAGNVMVQIADTCVVLNIGSSSYCKEDEDGNIWYIKDTGLYEYNINLRSNIRKYNFGHAKPDFIGSQFLPSLTDRNNHVWVGDYSRYDGGNLIEYNGHDFVTYSLETLSGGMPQIGIYSILEDKETGVKYFGLSNGRIAVYNDTSWYFDSLSPAITDQGRYGDVWIDALALDRNNHLIAGMDEPSGLSEGLGIKDSLGWHIINLLPYGSFGLMTNNVLSIKVDTSHGRNDYWIGTKDDGIIIKNDTGYIHLDKWNSPLPDNAIQTIGIDNYGRKWIGTYNGFAIYNDTTWVVYSGETNPLCGKDIEYINFNPNDGYTPWIATDEGICYFDGIDWTCYLPVSSPLISHDVESITFDHDCNVWLPIESERREYHGAGISRINNVCGMLAKKIQGHVSKNDGTDFPSHRVEFYKKMGNDLILLGAAKTDSNGNYRFSTMEDSIFLNSTYDGHVDAELPVYAENVLTRQNSHSILLNSSGITTVDIRHLPKAIPSGIGTIEGSITNMNDDTLKKMRIFLVNMETNEIYNTTLIKNPLTFRFINLPVGHYQIFCDKFGIIDSLSPILHISTEYPKLEHLPFVLKPDRLALRATYYETGLAEISNKPEFISIFPNPVAQILNTQITISAPSKTAIELFNLNGSMIYHAEYNCQKGDNLFQIITTSFNNGLYILKVKNENNIYTTKVLIQHQN